jgi:hypothetical protein
MLWGGKANASAPHPRFVTTQRLRELARDHAGVDLNQSTQAVNRQIGRLFESFVKWSVSRYRVLEGQYTYASPVRQAWTAPATVYSVRPDIVMNHYGVPFDRSRMFPESAFAEIKAVGGTIKLNHDRHQTRGLLDALVRSSYGAAPDRHEMWSDPALVYFTTWNTNIGDDVRGCAWERGVQLMQGFVYELWENDLVVLPPMRLLPVKMTGLTSFHFPKDF